MSTKTAIWVSILILSTVGGWIGSYIGKGGWFSPASIILGFAGSFLGIWVGFKVGNG